MSAEQRTALISKIEELRGSKLICYLTSLRPGVPAQMAEDQVRVIFDHLLQMPSRPEKQIDIFLVSNGGSGTVPWRLTAVLREFAERFCVLIPYRAYSAATMLALAGC
jgi:ATP-dependent protease ClpP protease subunit